MSQNFFINEKENIKIYILICGILKLREKAKRDR